MKKFFTFAQKQNESPRTNLKEQLFHVRARWVIVKQNEFVFP